MGTRRRRLWPLMALGCVFCQGFPPFVSFPTSINTSEPQVAVRIPAASTDSQEVYRAIATIMNDHLLVSDFIMRGGLPYDDAGNLTLPTDSTPSAEADLALMVGATAPEQVRAVADRKLQNIEAPYDEAFSVDACGNPQIAAFVTPAVLQDVYPWLGADVANISEWPQVSTDPSFDDSVQGVFDAELTKMRADGMVDMLLKVQPSVNAGAPGYWGHMVMYYLTGNNPDVDVAPVIVNLKKVTLNVFDLTERLSAHEWHDGPAEVFVYPHKARVAGLEEVSAALEPNKRCADTYAGLFPGMEGPYGCNPNTGEAYALLLETNSTTGSTILAEDLDKGKDPHVLNQLVLTLQYQLATNIACPSVPQHAYVKEGPVEVFLCNMGPSSFLPPSQGRTSHVVTTCPTSLDTASCTSHRGKVGLAPA